MSIINLKEQSDGTFSRSLGYKVVSSVVYVLKFGVYLVYGMFSACKSTWNQYKDHNPKS